MTASTFLHLLSKALLLYYSLLPSCHPVFGFTSAFPSIRSNAKTTNSRHHIGVSLSGVPASIQELFLGKQQADAAVSTGGEKQQQNESIQNIQGRLSRLPRSRLLYILASFVGGFALGRAGERHVVIVRRIAAVNSSRIYARTWFLATIIMGLFLREIWRGIPPWLRLQLVPWRKETSQPTGRKSLQRENSDMTNLRTLASKLQSLFQLASEKMARNFEKDDDDGNTRKADLISTSINLEAALFVYLRLVRQIQQYRPDVRNRVYEVSKNAVAQTEATAKRHPLHNMNVKFELADMAYNELPGDTTLRQALAEKGYDLLRHDATNLPGSVAHYVALDRMDKVAVIAVKGTSSLEDFLTDCCGVAVTETLAQPLENNQNRTAMSCHDGILTASKRLLEDLLPLVEDLLLPSGYRILLTGHSLGAGVAGLVGILLWTRLSLTKEQLEVVAFASPPVVDSFTAMAAAPFVTTVVNKADIIPRSSLANLAILKHILSTTIRPRMEEKGLVPKDFTSTKALAQYLFRESEDASKSSWLVQPEEVEPLLEEALSKVPLDDPDHLYVPGRVLHMFSLWKGGEVETDSPNEASNAADGVQEILPTARTLRYFEVDVSMVTDHLSPGYRSSIKELLENQANERVADVQPLI